MMKKVDVDMIILRTFDGKSSRFNYFLSLLILVVGFYYFFEYYDPNTCHVCIGGLLCLLLVLHDGNR